MNSLLAQARDVFANILESWGMMMVDAAAPDGAVFDPDRLFFVASISFEGTVKGGFTIVCQEPFARALERNLLVQDREATLDELADAVRELVNILSGNCLTTFFSEETIFSLTSPALEIKSWAETRELVSKAMVTLMGDDEPVAFVFTVDLD